MNYLILMDIIMSGYGNSPASHLDKLFDNNIKIRPFDFSDYLKTS